MKVFISWSGDTSKALAEALRQWLPAVLQALRPYYSPDDIAKGARWSAEIAAQLAEARVGLICVTRTSLEAPWVMFEAGALSKNLGAAKVVPLLFGVEPTDLTGPLVQFQAARFDAGDMKRVVLMLNTELGEAKLASETLDSVFDMWWPKLQEKVDAILADAAATGPAEAPRPERELLEEVLTLARSLTKRPPSTDASPAALRDLMQGVTRLLRLLASSPPSPDMVDIIEDLERPLTHFAVRLPPSIRDELRTALVDFKTASTEDDDLPF